MLKRRRFLKMTTGAAAAAAALPFGSFGRALAQPSIKRNVVVLFVRGGWDIQAVLDPKPDAAQVDNPPGSTDTDIQDFGVGGGQMLLRNVSAATANFFNAWADKTVVVNGLDTRSIAHGVCYQTMLTGLTQDGKPDLTSMVAHDNYVDEPVPGFVLGATTFSGPYPHLLAQTGVANQITTLADPANSGFPLCVTSTLTPGACTYDPGNPGRGGAFIPEQAFSDRVEAKLDEQAAAFVQRTANQTGRNRRLATDYETNLVRTRELAELNFGGSSYTFSQLQRLEVGRQLLLRRGPGQSAYSKAVLAGSTAYFDTHANNYPAQINLQDALWNDLGAFLTVMYDPVQSPGITTASLGEETVVVVLSEMSRTPRLNANNGKDHWPVTSALVIGPGVAGGKAVGATDDAVNSVPIDLSSGVASVGGEILSPRHLLAAILDITGADPGLHFPGLVGLDAIKA